MSAPTLPEEGKAKMDFIAKANEALEQRARLVEELRATYEDRVTAPAEREQKAARLNAEIDRLKDVAESYVREAERERENRELTERAAKLAQAPEGRREERDSEARMLAELARGERRGFVSEYRGPARGRLVLPWQSRAASAPSLTSNSGGQNTVPQSFATEVIDAMYHRSPLFDLARKLFTASGEQINYPVKVRTSGGRALVPTSPATDFSATEGQTLTISGREFATMAVNAYKRGTIAQISKELVEDSNIDHVSMVTQDLGEDLIDDLAPLLLDGTGSSTFEGWRTVAEAASGNPSDLGTIADLDFDALIDLYYALPRPYRNNAIFYTSDAALAHLRKLKYAYALDTAQSPSEPVSTGGAYIWTPSTQAGEPDTILGRPVVTDPYMTTTGSNVGVVLFGDPSRFLIRIVRGVEVSRSDEYGWGADLISIKGTIRADSVVTDGRSVRCLRVDA